MKKYISAAVIAATLLTLAGCSNSAANSSESTSASTAESVTSSEATSAPETSAPESTPEEAVPDMSSSRCAELAQAAVSAVEFPAMEAIYDAEIAKLSFGIDTSLCEDYCIMMNLISAQLNEVIVLKPSAGNEETLQKQVNAHLDFQKQNAVWYPAQEESVAGAATGITDGGYIYPVIHADGQTAADAIIAAE